MYYQVSGTVVESTKDGKITNQIPTFYLHRDVQGIVSVEHAIKIAKTVVDPLNKASEIHLYAFLVRGRR